MVFPSQNENDTIVGLPMREEKRREEKRIKEKKGEEESYHLGDILHATKTTDNRQYVPVAGIDHDRSLILERVRIEGHIQIDIVNLTATETATGLHVIFRLRGETVEIDEGIWDGRVVLIGLRGAEILGETTIESVHAVQLDESRIHKILGHTDFPAVRRKEIGIIEPFTGIAHTILLDNPNKFLTEIVEDQRHIHNGGTGRDRLSGRILELGDQILMFLGGKELAFLTIQKDVVPVELEPGNGDGWNVVTLRGGVHLIYGPPEILEAAQMHNETYGVGLECNEGESGSQTITEPEPEGDCESLGGPRICCIRIDIPVSDHLTESVALVGRCNEFRPDLEPLSGVFVNLLVSDFNADILNQGVSDIVTPVNGSTIHGRECRKIHFQKERGEKISLAGNQTADPLAEIRGTVKINGNGLNGEGRVLAPYGLKVGHLGLTSDFGILFATGR
jgi:hypothetical protein